MSYNPDISAARREAKRRARETGASYQTSLEEIARRSGADSWSSFLAHPVPIVAAADDGSDAPVATAGPSVGGGGAGARRALILALVCLVLAAATWGAWRTWSDGVRAQALGVAYDDERAAAAKVDVPALLPGRDAYAVAGMMPGDRRMVHLTYFDWRPIPRGPVTDAVVAARRALGYEREIVRDYRDHPVVRVQGELDCRTGAMRWHGTFLADDLVSPGRQRSGPNRGPIALPGTAAATLCSRETLARTARVAALTQEHRALFD